MIAINAENHIMGRLASETAKMLLSGEQIVIVNAGKVVISGNPNHAIDIYTNRIAMRGDALHGPFYPKKPQEALRRTIRGMLPYRTTRGAHAFKLLKVFNSVPEEFAKTELRRLPEAENKLSGKFITLEGVLKGL
jgi:large subunit ribosomal protein L13